MNGKIALILVALLLSCTFALRVTHRKSHALDHEWGDEEQGEDWSEGSCSTGTEQSPINIVTSTAKCSNQPVLQVTLNSSFTSEIINNGHTYECEGEASKIICSVSTGNLAPFEAAQFYFHAPSEHTIDGKRYDLEVHIV